MAKVAIIGAGVIGVSAAYYLAKAGRSVILIDRQKHAGLETSFANGGLLTPSMPEPWNAPGILWQLIRWIGDDHAPIVLRPRAVAGMGGWGLRFVANSRRSVFLKAIGANVALSRYSLNRLQELRGELGLDLGADAKGTLKIFGREDTLKHAEALSREASKLGVAYRPVTTGEAVGIEPTLEPIADRIAGGIHYPQDESGDAHLYCRSMERRLAELGVEFRFDTTVKALRTRRGRVASIETDASEIAADEVVVAAANASDRLLRGVGLRLSVRPVKGYSLTLPCGDNVHKPSLPVIDDAVHAAVTPFHDRIRVAGTAEICGYDTRLSPVRVANLKRLLLQSFPELAASLDLDRGEAWAGFRPVSADGVPIIGKTPLEGLFVAAGHGHLGWTQAAGSGRLIADLMLSRTPEIPSEPYRYR